MYKFINIQLDKFLSVHMFHIWQTLKSFHFFDTANFLSEIDKWKK